MRLPIRARLTIWYVALLALVIATLGAFVVVRLRADLTDDFDRSLRSAAGQIRDGALSATVTRVLPADSGSQLVTPDGRVARRTGADLPITPLADAHQRREALGGRNVTFTTHGPHDSEPFRVFVTTAVAGSRGGARGVLVVAASLEGIDSAVHRVLILLLLAGPAALAVIAAGGWWLARKALLPVAQVTEQAERIEVDSLAERVPVPPTSDEIAQLAVTLNRMLDRLERGVDEKRQLVADASHELRTPLAVMRSELDVALGYARLEPEAREVLASAREEVERMTRTVENLLTLARADEGRLELLRRPLSLRDVVDDVAADLGPIAAERGVRLTAAGDGAHVEADRDRIRQLAANLVDNAVKYSRPGGEVRVESWRRNGAAGLRVADDGVGIPASALPHLFERFYRVDSSRSGESGGSGLGLAICQEIAAAHGGRLSAESEEGRGSTFTLALPAVADESPR